ncbi:hypothetical protein EfmAA96_19980 [Enterococcus faecium]|nr:hypothetical protein EfmAA96_19980 [Enterococcus faecium]
MVLRDQLPEYAEEFVSFAEKGYRVLVFGVYDGILEEPVLTEAVIFLDVMSLPFL